MEKLDSSHTLEFIFGLCFMSAVGVTLALMDRETSDEDLMLQYRDGDAAAFESLYRRHKDATYRFMLRLCRNEAIAEELFQDVWLKLINTRERYEVKAKFTTYLYQLAHNHFIDYYRKQKNRNGLNSNNDESDCIDDLPGNKTEQPDQKASLQEQTEHLMQLIDSLPDEQREAFILREESGMSVNEIALATGVNAETAKSRLRYAVKKLRQGLDYG